MQATVEYEPFVRKILQKSEQGRLDWEKRELPGTYMDGVSAALAGLGIQRQRPVVFVCTIEGQYTFQSQRTDQGYQLRMLDSDGNEIFSITGEQAVVYDDPKKEELFTMLRDLYELARRKALKVDEKIATAAGLLDKV